MRCYLGKRFVVMWDNCFTYHLKSIYFNNAQSSGTKLIEGYCTQSHPYNHVVAKKWKLYCIKVSKLCMEPNQSILLYSRMIAKVQFIPYLKIQKKILIKMMWRNFHYILKSIGQPWIINMVFSDLKLSL